MRKILLVILTMMMVLSSVAFFACNKITDESSSSVIDGQIEVTVVEEVTLPVGSTHIPEITIKPEGTEFTVKVTDPDGKDVTLGDNYSFVLDKFGEYTLKVLVGGEEKASCLINAVDGNGPVVKTPIADKEGVELGVYDKFAEDLATLVAEDDQDGTNLSSAVETIRFADEKPQTIVEGKAVLNKVGVYTVYGYVSDMTGNRTEISYKINTQDTTAPVLACKDLYYAWADDNGNVVLPAVEVTDNGQTTVETVVTNNAGEVVEVKDGAFVAVVGQYNVAFTANDGYNKSETKNAVIRVLKQGTLYDFTSENDGNMWAGATYGENVVTIAGEEKSEVVATMTIADWSDYGYMVINVKNNQASDVTVNVSVADKSEVKDCGAYLVPKNYDGEVVVYFRDSQVNAGEITSLNLMVEGSHDISVKSVELKNLPEEIFTLPENEYQLKTYENFNAPEITYVNDFDTFVKDTSVEVVGTKDYSVEEDGSYIFEKEGIFSIVYKVMTKTSQIYQKDIKVIVTKGEAVLVIKNLPLGVVNTKAYISRFAVHNVEEKDIKSVKAYYTAPGTTEEVEIEGDINGFSFIPAVVGNYNIRIVADTTNGVMEASKKMYVKPTTEVISYEDNNGVYEGSTSQNDWLGSGEMSINFNEKYVYSGNSSVRFDIPAGKNSGITYFLENKQSVSDPDADVIQFMITAEQDTALTIYIYLLTTNGDKYGYSDYIYLKANQWTVYTAPLASFFYNGNPINMGESKLDALGGFEFGNKGGDSTFYFDQISVFNHKDMTLVTPNADVETEAFKKLPVPYANKVFPAKSYETYTEKLYNEATKEEIDLTGKTEFFFAKPGTYIYEVNYKYLEVEGKVTQKYTVKEATEASLMVDELHLDMMTGTTYVLPAYMYNLPGGVSEADAQFVLKAILGEKVVEINKETREFVADESGMWKIEYQLSYGGKVQKTVTYETFVRAPEDLFTFETTSDGTVVGPDQGDGNIGVSINTDPKYVTSGKQSLKLTYNVDSYGDTTYFGSDTAYWLNVGIIKNGYGVIGYTEGKSKGANAITFKLYAEKDGQIILDLPGVAAEWNYEYSKIYNVKAGWNDIRFDNGCKYRSSSADVDFSQGIYKFFIASYYADGKPAEGTTMYVDDVKLIFDESSYELKSGEAVTFEKIDGAYQGKDLVEPRNAANTAEISSEWASQGNNSLKICYDNTTFTTDAWREAKGGYNAINLISWDNGFGIKDAHVGMNALEATFYPNVDMDFVFEVYYTGVSGNTWAYTPVYHVVGGKPQVITISKNDVSALSGCGGPIIFENGFVGVNIFRVDLGNGNVNRESKTDVLYVDGFKFVNIPEYSRHSGEIASFERGPEGIIGANQFSSNTGCTHAVSFEWASHGTNSIKVQFDKSQFAETHLAGKDWKRGVIAIGDYGHPSFPEGAYNEIPYGTNAIAFSINASEDFKAIFEVYYPGKDGQNNSRGWGAYTRVYDIKKGENFIVIGENDGENGTKIDFKEGIGQLNMNYVVETTVTEGKSTIFFDDLSYYRIKTVLLKNNIATFEGTGASFDGLSDIKRGAAAEGLVYERSEEWAVEGTSSLKLTINKKFLADSDFQGCNGRAILYAGAWGDAPQLGGKDIHVGKNAIRMVVKATNKCRLVFDIGWQNDAGVWSKVYQLHAGINEIVIYAGDGLGGSTVDFTNGLLRFNINYLNDGERAGTDVLYIDDFAYVDIH